MASSVWRKTASSSGPSCPGFQRSTCIYIQNSNLDGVNGTCSTTLFPQCYEPLSEFWGVEGLDKKTVKPPKREVHRPGRPRPRELLFPRCLSLRPGRAGGVAPS